MYSVNPYESPQTSETPPAKPEPARQPTRFHATARGMWRGAGWGFWSVAIFGWCSTGPEILRTINAMQSQQLSGAKVMSPTVCFLTVFVFVPALAAVFGAAPGAFLMGLIAALRWRPPANLDNSTVAAS